MTARTSQSHDQYFIHHPALNVHGTNHSGNDEAARLHTCSAHLFQASRRVIIYTIDTGSTHSLTL